MLSRIDEIIYPNRCEVIEIEPSQRYIYPIYKNGSGSITEYANIQKYRYLFNEQIRNLNTIDIIIREPVSRFVSGVNTYVFNTLKEHPNLDLNTVVYFVENYLFLNRHYSPQLGWLLNLNRYTKKDVVVRVRGMASISDYTPVHIRPNEKQVLTDNQINHLKNNVHNQTYIQLDNLLLELVGQDLTFMEILEYIKNKNPTGYLKLKCVALD
jgi:hypothetical protein